MEIRPLIIDGVKLPFMHSYEFNINALTYTKSPVRSESLAISNINDLFYDYVPRLWVEFNYISLKDYQFLLRLINKPEFTITHYDWEKDTYVTHKYYLEPSERQRINAFSGVFFGVVSLVLNFISTNNPL